MYREYHLININAYKIHIYAQIIHHMQWLPHARMVKDTVYPILKQN